MNIIFKTEFKFQYQCILNSQATPKTPSKKQKENRVEKSINFITCKPVNLLTSRIAIKELPAILDYTIVLLVPQILHILISLVLSYLWKRSNKEHSKDDDDDDSTLQSVSIFTSKDVVGRRCLHDMKMKTILILWRHFAFAFTSVTYIFLLLAGGAGTATLHHERFQSSHGCLQCGR